MNWRKVVLMIGYGREASSRLVSGFIYVCGKDRLSIRVL
jgi:hypothetical protein